MCITRFAAVAVAVAAIRANPFATLNRQRERVLDFYLGLSSALENPPRRFQAEPRTRACRFTPSNKTPLVGSWRSLAFRSFRAADSRRERAR
jgi:hypothetical protein